METERQDTGQGLGTQRKAAQGAASASPLLLPLHPHYPSPTGVMGAASWGHGMWDPCPEGQDVSPHHPRVSHLPPSPLAPQCEKCNLHFRHKSQLRLHLRQKHGAITNTKVQYRISASEVPPELPKAC